MEPSANDLVSTRSAPEFRGLAIPVPTAATYDVATEGRTGWRFVLTRRWIAFVVGALVYATGCAAGVIWQWQLGQQIAQFNATVSRNFDAAAVPLDDILPTLGSYRAAEQWRPVTATGTYLTADQLYVSERTCGSDTGFEVLTPLRLTDDRMLVVDRGCVASSAANPTLPSRAARPPAGLVTVTARVVASESAKGAAAISGNQVAAIDLPQIARKLGASTFTGAYGMLASEQPTPARSLHTVLTGRPTVDASAQLGTIFGTALYAIVGLGIFAYALREKFRFVNRFDPRLWRRELKRIQRLARKPYTDAEIEDMQVDGYSVAAIRALAAGAAEPEPARELE